jgi:two-component system CheB/CheR fusion protein
VKSLKPLVSTLRKHNGFAVVISCPGESDIAATLRPISALPVIEVNERARLEPDRIFVVPSHCDAAFHRGELRALTPNEPRAPIDRLLRSLTDELGGQVAGVILRSRGSDGLIGIKHVKEAGGLTIAQTPEGADTEMPRSAIATGMIDLVLPLSEIGARLASFGGQHEAGATQFAPLEEVARESDEIADSLRDILALVRIRSGHDFGSYKRATLYRRVMRRMQVCGCESIATYHQYLREHPSELGSLLRDFLISVTNFFRDRSAFEALDTAIIPTLLAGRTPVDQVRVWVPGCATGEEAYSLGILLVEHASRMPHPPQLQIFATDIDDDALAEARTGRYPNTIAVDVSPERLGRFFTADGDYFRVHKELREIVLFSPHNLLRDPPFSRLDLVSCRNLLIYLNRDAQDRALNVFHFALRPEGFLFLGSSESAENVSLFTAFDAKHRLFSRRSDGTRLTGDALLGAGRWHPPDPLPPVPQAERLTAGELHHRVVEQYAPPSILVNDDLDIVHVSEQAGRLLRISGGEPSRQLLRLIHPALRSDVRTAIYNTRQSDGGNNVRTVRFDDDGASRVIEIRVRKVDRTDLGRGSLLVLFDERDPPGHDATSDSQTTGLEPMMREIEDELRRTREQLRTTIEQYETSLEELQASNEELQAINEELRSATEELETSKEELWSVNEELTTLNHELKVKVDEVIQTNSDLQNLMTSTDIGVVFLDRGLNIKRFTPRAQELFNVIPGDIGRPLAHLTHRLEAEDLPDLAHTVLQTLRTLEREIRSRDGRMYLARLLPYRSLEDKIDGVVLTLVEVTDLRDAINARRRTEAALQATEARLRFALRAVPMLAVSQNARLETTWGYLHGEVLSAGSTRFTELLAPGNAQRFIELTEQVLADGQGQRAELDVVIGGERRTYDFRIERNDAGIDAVGFDVTPNKLAEAALLDADRRKDEFLATLSHELRNPLTPLKMALDIVKLGGSDPARLEHSRAIMERQVAQLSHLVDGLLDLSRITQGKIEIQRVPLDPAAIVEAAIETARPMIQQRNHELKVDLPKVPCRVLGDKTRLVQVLTNLLDNAAKYTPRDGHLRVALEADTERRMLRIRVQDDGDGIAPEMLPKIFDIFFQCRDPNSRARGGLGIGLNLVRRLVELHDGTASASSPGVGRGSEFIVELPLAPEKNQRP